MRSGGSLLIGILFASVLSWWVSGSIGVVSSEEPAKCNAKPAKCRCDVEELLFPPDRSVLLSGTVNVVCKTTSKDAKLTIDRQPRQWESFQPPLRVSRLTLPPGVHELRIGNYRSEFCIAMNPEEHDAPSDWKTHYSHPMENMRERRCAACHETKQDDKKAFIVGRLKPDKACFECHSAVDFKETREHTLEPAKRCQDCHSLHGSDRKALLKPPAKKLHAK